MKKFMYINKLINIILMYYYYSCRYQSLYRISIRTILLDRLQYIGY